MPILGGVQTGPGEDEPKGREDVGTRKSVQYLIEGAADALVAMLAGFCQFLRRGTLSEGCELLIAGFGAQDLLICVQNLQTPPRTVHVEQHHQPNIASTMPHNDAPHNNAPHNDAPHNDALHNDAISHDTIPHDAIPHDAIPHDTHKNTEPHEPANDYFRKKFEKAKSYRIERLVRVANSFAKVEDLSTFSTLNHPKDPKPENPIAQAIAIYQTLQKVSDRKYPIYFADAVERCVLSASIEGSEQTKKTAAFNQICTQLGRSKKEVVNMDTLGKKYLTCMERGGVASLYSINCAVSDITQLNDEEMTVLCEYRRVKMPEKEKVSTDANIDVAMSLRTGLLALGFEDADIARGNTTLTKVITRTVRTSKKRKRKNLEDNGRPTTSDVESSTSWKRSIPKPRHDGVTAQAGDQHFSNVYGHLKHQADITPCFEEERNMQRVDTMYLYAPALCQDDVVEACETPREAEVEERHGTETSTEGCQTPVLITDSVVADNDSSFSPRPSGQDRPEYSHSTILPCSTPTEVICSSATSLMGGSREESILTEATRNSSTPNGQVINKESTAATTTPTENAESLGIANSFTVGDQQRQHSENARSVVQSGLHTAFEGEHHINPTSYPEDIGQTHHGQSMSVDPSLPSYGLSNLFPEPDDESFHWFLENSSH
ncbi:hypothetical protein CC86DRAFT_461194 [Ophiobolus disseminans]|uniref:Uncharacterized protein n=1 Tax=Ophiobolus disseminans TaxID=1469910 RepID=A0A6A6ZD45_9PLEO|nr:hypothetical protein CC86DRAFT_461194 [Ophiobolus disseminans]